jgi:Icc protein
MTAPMPPITILHLSDTHILAADADRLYGQDTLANLQRVIDHVAAHDVTLDAVVITGDLANDGDLTAYQRLRAMLAVMQERFNAPVFPVMGNHDRRETMREGLLGEPASVAQYHYIQEIGGLRLIVLDSSVPGQAYGLLGADQLAWLHEQLRTPAPRGTVLALHHPPFQGTVPTLNTIMLGDYRALAALLPGTDVRAILAGHVHYPGAATIAGVPGFTAPAVAYQTDPLHQNGYIGFAGYGCNLVRIMDETITVSTIMLHGPFPEISRTSKTAAEMQERQAIFDALGS